MSVNATSDNDTASAVGAVGTPTFNSGVATAANGNPFVSQPVSDDPNGQTWQDRYNGIQGVLKKMRNEGTAAIELLTAEKTARDEEIAKLRQTLEGNAPILAEFPTVKETLTAREQELAAAQAKLERTNLLLKHRVHDDALTKLVLASQLSTEELEETLVAFSQASVAAQTAAVTNAAQGSVGVTGSPVATNSNDEIATLREKADVAMRAGKLNGPDGFWTLNGQWAKLVEESKKG